VRLVVVVVLALGAGIALLVGACGGSDAPEGPPAILLVSTRDGDYAVYGMDADGGGERRLTEEAGDPATPEGLFFQTEPAWSPDGTRIAFTSKREGNVDIYVMDASGDGTTRLTSTNEDESSPSWSPDGRRIVFSRGQSGDLFVIRADGSSVEPLLTDASDDRQPEWAPDGSWIAFTRREPGAPARELWLLRPDGSAAKQLTSLDSVIDGPTWSPDSRRIAFATDNQARQFDIYTIAADGSGSRRFTASDEESFEPAWSPDGSTIVWSEGGSILSKQFTIEGAGENEELTEPDGNDSSPAWRPTYTDAPS
jgi:Tol biopolymer transport system component